MIDTNFIQYLRRRNYKERDVKILEDRMNGLTYPQIGKSYGITGNRVRQIYERYLRMSKHPSVAKRITSIESSDLFTLKLTPALCGKLQDGGIMTIAQLEAFIGDSCARLLEIEGLGAKDAMRIVDCLIARIREGQEA